MNEGPESRLEVNIFDFDGDIYGAELSVALHAYIREERRFPGLELSVSATTRAPRPGEEEGRDYWFLSPEEFERRLEAGEFLEHATYAGNRYGTLRSELDSVNPAAGDGPRGLVLEIELQGARQVRTALPEAHQVFIKPP